MIAYKNINEFISSFPADVLPLPMPNVHYNAHRYLDLTANREFKRNNTNVLLLLEQFLQDLSKGHVDDDKKARLGEITTAYLDSYREGCIEKIINFILGIFGFRTSMENMRDAFDLLLHTPHAEAGQEPTAAEQWVKALENQGERPSIGAGLQASLISAVSDLGDPPHFLYVLLGRPTGHQQRHIFVHLFPGFGDEMKRKGLPDLTSDNCLVILFQNQSNSGMDEKHPEGLWAHPVKNGLDPIATVYGLSPSQETSLYRYGKLPDDLIELLTQGPQAE